MLVVQLCDFGGDGDAQYRIHQPSRGLGALAGVSVVDCHFAHRGVPDLARAADVLVIQFFDDWEVLSLCGQRRRAGKVTVFEANDYFFDLPVWSPIASHWRDRAVQELYGQMLIAADGVQTSSQSLAEQWRRRGARSVAVFENQLARLDPLPQEPARAFTVGWAGSPGHFADLFSVAPLLSSWLDAHPEVHLAVMTNGLAKDFFSLPTGRYHFAEFGSLQEYLRFLRRIDVGIAPLLPTAYNRGRSDVKFLEYSSCGVAGVYPDLEPYRRVVQHGTTGMSYRTPDELIAALNRLHDDRALRQRIRRQAYDYVANNRMLADHVGDRLEWYRRLGATTPTPAVTRGPAAAGGYRQVRLEEPEKAMLAALGNPGSHANADALAELAVRHPDYLALLQNEGKLLNDRGEHLAAMDCLQQARTLAPGSPRTWSEIGRTHHLFGNPASARQALAQALRLCPAYLPGWQYLLRLNAITNSEDAESCADEAIRLFPTCYPVALLAMKAYRPAKSVVELRRLLDRIKPTLTPLERPVALPALREAILAAVSAAPCGRDTLALLVRACEVFPESALLAGQCGTALFSAGQGDLANLHLARAASLRSDAAAVRDEFPAHDQTPWTWVFARHIESLGARHDTGVGPVE